MVICRTRNQPLPPKKIMMNALGKIMKRLGSFSHRENSSLLTSEDRDPEISRGMPVV